MQIKARVDHWLRTNSSVSDLTHSFSVSGLKTDLGVAQMDGSDQLFKRVDLFNQMRDNSGMFLLNKETEEFFNVATPLGGLSELQAQSLEFICAASGLPLLKFTGISPSGLNATSEFEMKSWYENVHAYQEQLFRPNLTTVINFAMLNIWGHTDPDITFAFEPLHSLDEVQLATVRKTESDTHQTYVDLGAVSPEEVRRAIAGDPDSVYQGLDPDDLPDLREEEIEGLAIKGATPVIDPADEEAEPSAEDEAFAFDRASIREIDVDGRLHVGSCNISREGCAPYLGREVPSWESFGLNPDQIYMFYRDPLELRQAISSFNKMPILDRHWPAFGDNFASEVQRFVVGATGESAVFEPPYLKNSLCVWSADAIDLIQSGDKCELSCGYRWVPVLEPGITADGVRFAGRMTQLQGNHLALVDRGRNPGCAVAQEGEDD